jgi:hypothetical protein
MEILLKRNTDNGDFVEEIPGLHRLLLETRGIEPLTS